MTLAEAAKSMADAGHGSLGVFADRALVGIFTERDLLRALGAGVEPTTESVENWMSRDPDVFHPDTDVEEAARWLLESGYRHLPVVEDGELLGIVSVRDLLRAVLEP